MRALLLIATTLMALWSGYWFVGKTTVERSVQAFLQGAEAQGLRIRQDGYGIAGFPNRFDLTVMAPDVFAPQSGWGWMAPFVQVFSLSYTPWHVIAAFAPDQSIVTPTQTIALQSGKLQASLVVTPGTALALDRTTVIGDGLKATSTLGWTLAADQVRFATRLDPSRTDTHQIGLEIIDLIPDPALSARVPDLPATIATVRLDTLLSFSGPIDRFAGQTQPQVTAVSIREILLAWGDLSVFAEGDLDIVNAYPQGRISIRVTGWRNLVAVATGLGLLNPDVAPTAMGMLEALAASSGDPEVLELPLVFDAGRMSLGPLPLGPAPRLGQRQ